MTYGGVMKAKGYQTKYHDEEDGSYVQWLWVPVKLRLGLSALSERARKAGWGLQAVTREPHPPWILVLRFLAALKPRYTWIVRFGMAKE